MSSSATEYSPRAQPGVDNLFERTAGQEKGERQDRDPQAGREEPPVRSEQVRLLDRRQHLAPARGVRIPKADEAEGRLEEDRAAYRKRHVKEDERHDVRRQVSEHDPNAAPSGHSRRLNVRALLEAEDFGPNDPRRAGP